MQHRRLAATSSHLMGTASAAADDGPVVRTSLGPLLGLRHGEADPQPPDAPLSAPGTLAFLGVPYCKQPVPPRRFLPVQPLEQPWSTPRPCVERPPVAPQPLAPQLADAVKPPSLDPSLLASGELPAGQSEACCFLNIYAPLAPQSEGKLRPVCVWFHGGGMTFGSSKEIDGSWLAKRADVIVVTVQCPHWTKHECCLCLCLSVLHKIMCREQVSYRGAWLFPADRWGDKPRHSRSSRGPKMDPPRSRRVWWGRRECVRVWAFVRGHMHSGAPGLSASSRTVSKGDRALGIAAHDHVWRHCCEALCARGVPGLVGCRGCHSRPTERTHTRTVARGADSGDPFASISAPTSTCTHACTLQRVVLSLSPSLPPSPSLSLIFSLFLSLSFSPSPSLSLCALLLAKPSGDAGD